MKSYFNVFKLAKKKVLKIFFLKAKVSVEALNWKMNFFQDKNWTNIIFD